MDIPAWRHFLNRHARQVIFDVETIRQLLFSAQWYRSGAFSLIDRRKKPFNNLSFRRDSSLFGDVFLLCTLHKWQRRNECPMLMHRKQDMATSCTNLRSLVQLILQFHSLENEEEEEEENADRPWGFMPKEIHFSNRQYWHCVLERFVIEQEKSFWHLYFFFPSPVEMERRKNF